MSVVPTYFIHPHQLAGSSANITWNGREVISVLSLSGKVFWGILDL